MKKYYLLIILFTTINSFSQTTEDLYGKWEFKKVSSIKEPTKKPTEGLVNYLKDMAIDLSDKMVYYGTIMGINEVGSWEFKEGALYLSPRDGDTYNWKVIGKTGDELSLELKSFTVIMTRVGDSKIMQQ